MVGFLKFGHISLNTCRNTLDFICDLELFSKIRSQLYNLGDYTLHGKYVNMHGNGMKVTINSYVLLIKLFKKES